ncbi:hypothetical protein EJ02DRAFT_180612 [Clathrospora elynae]|uniref:DUF6535 domain-containing protein n=1 Tax=Clathrospora elynae TaxID=706981 RepID=A0A6A5SND1_9PLEO|nr:hypothetical protein EJ02DRAFT_180612 [Clathrospora elynae]
MSEQARPLVAAQPLKQQVPPTYSLLDYPLIIFTAPYRRAFKLYTWQPLREIRAANGDRAKLMLLMRIWKEEKYAELQSVQVAATFCGGAIFSTLPWARDEHAIWVTDALWYSALICAISAIITSIQTKSILDDLPSGDQLQEETLPEKDVQRMRRAILRYKKTPGVKHWVMLFIWQFPSMTMAYAWSFYLCGLTLYLGTPFIRGLEFSNDHKISIVYLSVALICLLTYLSATLFVYSGERELLLSVNSSREGTATSTRNSTIRLGTLGTQTGSDSAEEIDPVHAVRSHTTTGFEYRRRGTWDTSAAGRDTPMLLYS